MIIPSVAGRPLGHAHFWERATASGFSRAQFLRRSAAAVGGLAGLSLVAPAAARAAGTGPKPIPGGFSAADAGLPSPPFAPFYHVEAPGVITPENSEPITVSSLQWATIFGTYW